MHDPLFFPIFFVFLWLMVTTLLGWMSGWYLLANQYPDRPESASLSLAWQSGSVGVVGMRSLLKFSVCPSGLRVGMMRIFGIFCRDFFVPWHEIRIVRKDRVFWKIVKMSFGQPPFGTLTLRAEIADRLARVAADNWPEIGTFTQETDGEAAARIAKEWVATTGLAAGFCIIAPRLMMPKGAPIPPIAVAVLFPAIVFGIAGLVRYLKRQRD